MIEEAVAAGRYTGNGVTASFVYPFRITNQAHLAVYVDSVLKAVGTHYTVSGVGDATGSITFVTAHIPASGTSVAILRDQPLEQASDYVLNEGFPSARVEQDLDKLAMLAQMIDERIKRAIKFSRHSTLTDVEFPEPEAGKYLRATLTGFELVELTDSAVVDLVAGDVKALSDYASFAAAVTAIGATVTTLYVNQAATISTAVVVPATLHLVVIGSGSFTKSGSGTLTINGPFDAPIRTVFSGFTAGDVVGLKHAYPQWFGALFDDSTDDYAAWNSAIEAIAAGEVRFTPGTSRIGTGLVFPANKVLHGQGMRACILKYTGTSGFAITCGSTSSASLSYGCGVRDLQLALTDNGGNGIRLAGTAGAYLDHLYLEGIPSTNTSTAVYLDGGNAANIFTTVKNVIANHFKFGYELGSSGSSFTTSALFLNAEAFCDLIAGSIGFSVVVGNGNGVRFVGGNAEECAQGIKLAGDSTVVFGLRFEGNTTDVRLESLARVNSIIGCVNMGTVSDAAADRTNVFLGNQVTGGSPEQAVSKLDELFLYGDLTLQQVAATARAILMDAATSGHILIQAGPGSAALGGSLIMRGSSHAESGSVIVGLGGSSARKFRVNDDGLATGTDRFWVDNTGLMNLNGNNMKWAAAAPTTGTWVQGDIVWNTGAAAGGSPGWVCTTGGTPGTWKAMANVAA